MTTLGTRLFTWLRGELVGEDGFGNRYYHERGEPGAGRRRRRWVIYEGEVEASKVPPEWHAWLHHVADAPPGENAAERKPWQKPHAPNLTGTAEAYKPPGAMEKGARAQGMPAPYEPWRPSATGRAPEENA